jgi:hypothetical protein
MNHFWCVKITYYLHFFDSNRLIARLLLPQGNIPCDLCPFNILKFELKEGVSKNLILLNLFFCLACLIAPTPFPFATFFLLSFFMCCLSCCPSPFLPFFCPSCFLWFFGVLVLTTPLFLSFFLSCLSYCHTHTFSFSFSFILSFHTFPSSLLSLACPTAHSHNLPLSFFLPLYPITTLTFFPFYLILPCLSSQAHIHILSPSLCPFFFHVATHTPIFPFHRHKQGGKKHIT